MANVEIDENELAALRRYATVADKMAKHPEARKLVQQAALLADPDSVGSEPRIRAEMSEFAQSIRDELKADREARAKDAEEKQAQENTRALEIRWARGKSTARDAGYTDEGLDKLEKWMEDHSIADHALAMPAFERENPPPEPIMTGGQRWDFAAPETRQDVSLKSLFEGNEDGFLGPAIQSALKEVRGR